jgi:hypothetical protein
MAEKWNWLKKGTQVMTGYFPVSGEGDPVSEFKIARINPNQRRTLRMGMSLKKHEYVQNEIEDFRFTRVGKTIKAIIAEYNRAIIRNEPFNSTYEGWAILTQKMDELWGEIKKAEAGNPAENLHKYAAQIGALAMRFIVDLGTEERSTKPLDNCQQLQRK